MRLSALLVVGATHAHSAGSGVDYAGVFLASAASWAGFPGVGEAVLIAAGIAAANHHLELDLVVAAAWAGATAGGTAGWIVGLKGGRGLISAPGPLHHLRLSLIATGDRFYERYGLIAVLIAPSWIAGIHHMRSARFLPANAISALVWALAIAVGAYLLGPAIADAVADEGLAAGLLIAALIVLAVGAALWRSRAGRGAG